MSIINVALAVGNTAVIQQLTIKIAGVQRQLDNVVAGSTSGQINPQAAPLEQVLKTLNALLAGEQKKLETNEKLAQRGIDSAYSNKFIG